MQLSSLPVPVAGDPQRAEIDLRPFREYVEQGCPLYQLVPKDFTANLRFRQRLIRWGSRTRENAEALWIACSRDMLFYINTFAWTHDTRLKRTPRIPFITYPFQDETLTVIQHAVGSHDILIEKSRAMGASWMCLTVFEWFWHFQEYLTFLLVSWAEKVVDSKKYTGDSKSLFYKIDFLHKHMPSWLLPRIDRTHLHLGNLDTGGNIDGESTTGKSSRGDRRTAILLDEFAAVEEGFAVLKASRDATDCRIFNSTPQGMANAFYEQRQKGTPRLRLHWPIHPKLRVGLYTGDDGKPHSPWYDYQCARAANQKEIAQELDIDFLASSYQFYDIAVLEQLSGDEGDTRAPFLIGDLTFGSNPFEPVEFVACPEGRLKLWVIPDSGGRLPDDRNFVVAADVSVGTGASNSVIGVADRKTKELVAEFVSPLIQPHELGQMGVALAKWFKGTDPEGAYMIWESNGPGRIFGNQVIDAGYRNVYYREPENRLSRKPSDFPGWVATKESKYALHGEYRRALATRTFINRSQASIDECRMYVFNPNGQVLHATSANTEDPSGARDNHADRVTVAALLVRGLKHNPVREKKVEQVIPPHCYHTRRKEWEKRQKQKVGW